MSVPLGHALIGAGEEPAVDISCKEQLCSPSLNPLMSLPLPYSQPFFLQPSILGLWSQFIFGMSTSQCI